MTHLHLTNVLSSPIHGDRSRAPISHLMRSMPSTRNRRGSQLMMNCTIAVAADTIDRSSPAVSCHSWPPSSCGLSSSTFEARFDPCPPFSDIRRLADSRWFSCYSSSICCSMLLLSSLLSAWLSCRRSAARHTLARPHSPCSPRRRSRPRHRSSGHRRHPHSHHSTRPRRHSTRPHRHNSHHFDACYSSAYFAVAVAVAVVSNCSDTKVCCSCYCCFECSYLMFAMALCCFDSIVDEKIFC